MGEGIYVKGEMGGGGGSAVLYVEIRKYMYRSQSIPSFLLLATETILANYNILRHTRNSDITQSGLGKKEKKWQARFPVKWTIVADIPGH
jgi:hypothetical protein